MDIGSYYIEDRKVCRVRRCIFRSMEMYILVVILLKLVKYVWYRDIYFILKLCEANIVIKFIVNIDIYILSIIKYLYI